MSLTAHFPVIVSGEEDSRPPPVMGTPWGLRLTDGREVQLKRLQQHLTYAGLLAGIPLNPEADVAHAIEMAKDWDRQFHAQVIVIPAPIRRGTRTVLRRREVKLEATGFSLPWAVLPPVTCFGEFDSEPPPGSDGVMASSIAVWWQASFGLPQEEEAIALSQMDWLSGVATWDP